MSVLQIFVCEVELGQILHDSSPSAVDLLLA